MNEIIMALDKLYDEYLETMNRLTQDRANLRGYLSGILGGGGPGADSCNDQFARGVEAVILGLKSPDSDTTLSVMRHVLKRSTDKDCGRTAELMLIAVQKYLLELVPFLSSEGAEAFLQEYSEAYHKRSRLPVQQKLVNSLQERKTRG